MPLVLALPPVKMHTVIIEAGKSGKKYIIKKHLRHDEEVIKILSTFCAPVAPTAAYKTEGAT